MSRKQESAARLRWKEEVKQILAEDRDLLKSLIQEAPQKALECEMDEALQAEKSERTAGRLAAAGVGGADGDVPTGASTHKVKVISSGTISRMMQAPDEEL